MRLVSFCLAIASPILLFVIWTGRSNHQYRYPSASSVAQTLNLTTDDVSLTDALVTKEMTLGSQIFIRIFKDTKELELWAAKDDEAYQLIKVYPICSFSGSLGPKLKEGDMQSPEGFYFVSKSALLPTSQFHKAFNIGFPNAYDRAHGRTGSFLMVHGSCVSVGCYAMTNSGIDEIYTMAEAALDAGQPFFRVHIFPFRMTEENLNHYRDSSDFDFWSNLKEGFDHFEDSGVPPKVTVKDSRYVFSGD
jgi:murein L,D-transpeptidase YafK